MKCARHEREHVLGMCPRLSTHLVIDADNIDRVKRTGHPRLLKSMLAGTLHGMFSGLEISAITLDGQRT